MLILVVWVRRYRTYSWYFWDTFSDTWVISVHFLISSVIERIITLNSLLFLPEILLNNESGQMFSPPELLLRFALESRWRLRLVEEST
jgi:hypothetical protein